VCDCCATGAALTDHGPRVAYRDRADDETRDIAIAGDGSQIVHADGWKIDGCPVNGPAADALGDELVVGWYTLADDRARIRAAFSHDAGATFGDPIEVAAPYGERAPIGRVSIVLAGERAIVCWLEGTRGEASIMVRSVRADGTSGAAIELAKTSPQRSGVPRLGRSDDDLVVLWTVADQGLRAKRTPLASIP